MEKPKLTKDESELYIEIVKHGTMDDMFNLAYSIGRERSAEDALKIATKTYAKPIIIKP